MSQQLAFRLVQISDSHLFNNCEERLLGMDTCASFQSVVKLAYAQAQTAQRPLAAVLATGDIAQDCHPNSYDFYAQQAACFNAPILWLPGNHDCVDYMQGQLDQSVNAVSPCIFHQGNWSIIMLDSSIPNDVPGFLTNETLEYLKCQLEAYPQQNIMVCLHHQPIPMGSKWLDGVGLQNPEPLWQLLQDQPQVKALVWGHVHQELEVVHQGVRCFSVPSTCIQFKPKSAEFALDNVSPGYRWFDLYPNGDIESQVSRVQETFYVNMNSAGY